MRFQPGAVEFGEVAFEIVGNLKTSGVGIHPGGGRRLPYPQPCQR